MRNFVISFVVLVLLACSSGFVTGEFFEPVLEPDSGFYVHLEREYRNIAVYEAEESGNPESAAYFTAKAAQARRHVNTAPENPRQKDVPAAARADLLRAYDILRGALKNMYAPENEALLAMAQAKFDCWLAHSKQFPQQDAVLACKDDFYEAVSELSPPELEDGTFSIYFDSGGVVPDSQAMETVRKAADYSRTHSGWAVTLYSFTDSVGNREANQVLSMRRAIAVRNALAQQGVPLDSIHIHATGQSAAVKKQGDQVDDAQLRRVEINFRPSYEPPSGRQNSGAAAGWDHAGTN